MHHLSSLGRLLADPTLPGAVALLGLVLVLAAIAFLVMRTRPATLFSLGVGAEIFSGWWKYMGIPVPVDRLLFLAGFFVLAWYGVHSISDRRIVFSPIHVLFVVIVVWVVCSAIWAHTLTTSTGFYAILDRLGVIPYLMFTFAPVIFHDRRSRNFLLGVLVVVGFYISAVSIAEGLKLDHLVIPSYINDSHLGIHYGRARGPFLEAVADGLSMFMCAVAAAVGLSTWPRGCARWLCIAVLILSPIGIILTLTRTNWIAAAAGAVAALLVDRRLRRWIPVGLLVGLVVVAGAFIVDPPLHHEVDERTADVASVWPRYNLTSAAVRAWEQNPVFGLGWLTFPTRGRAYFRQAPDYPLTGVGLEVHNAFLERLAENGLPLTVLWVWALVTGIGGAMFRRGPPHLYAWRLGLIAIVVAWLVSANLDPMAYAFPNLLIWLWAGVVAADRYSRPGVAIVAEPAVVVGQAMG